jgi:uncharacterized membrane protein YfcA
MMIVAAALSLLIGIVLGMLGGGGAILTLPMLVYALHMDPKAAIATSLFVVGATSIIGMLVHARAGTVRWRVGSTFGLAAMAGAFAGGRLAAFIPASALLLLFGVVMLVTATAMLKGRKASSAAGERPLALGRALALGVSVGALSGLVGAGGGFLIVPALTLFGGLAMRESIGTSLLVIALQSFAGFAGHVTHVELDWLLIAVITGAAVLGSVAGATLGNKVPADVLRRAFAWLVVAMGLFLIAKQLPVIATVIVAAVTFTALFFVIRQSPRKPRVQCTTSPQSPR